MAGKIGGKGRRQKGQQGEREFFNLLNQFLPARLQLRRHLGQERDSGADGGTEFCAIEVKRQETLNLPGWLKQARESALPQQTAVVAYRRNGEKWQILVDMDMAQFAAWLKYRINLMEAEDKLRGGVSYGAGTKLKI